MPESTPTQSTGITDVFVIGGGVNGCGIARDAAGRGLSVVLCEQGDLAGGTSSASTKLVHGGLRYLEHYKFGLVRKALVEREVLWSIAPHLIRPLRFVLPHDAALRPAWLLRLGLFVYDYLGGRRALPPTRTLDLRSDPAGRPLKPGLFVRGFEYSDCWVDDARLVVLNARDAADRGARILTRTRFEGAVPRNGLWQISIRDARDGHVDVVPARVLVNAAGPFVAKVLETTPPSNVSGRIRLVRGSHIVVPQLFAHDRCYILQNEDRRIVFAIPYEGRFTLVGTTDLDHDGGPGAVEATTEEIAYLCAAASRYFTSPVEPSDVVWSYSGLRPLHDDGLGPAQAATRDYELILDEGNGVPLLSVYGGKITTYRRLAEATLAKLAAFLPGSGTQQAGWTGRTPLPGGDFAIDGAGVLAEEVAAEYPALDRQMLGRLVRAYGTLAPQILGSARSAEALGRDFGAGLTEAELTYLIDREWAQTAEDVVWRRSKLGLHMTAGQIAALDRWMTGRLGAADTDRERHHASS